MEDRRNLPEAFRMRMKRLLGTEWEAFQASYDKERSYGLRRNPLKSSGERFMAQMPYTLEKVSWAEEGYYYQAEEQPGKDVLHEAGVYYIQEPSAMAVVEILDPQPGERILDLCAAPGGKSTQIAGRMWGEGLLVANEVISDRARILSQNVERMGIKNCVVCSEDPEHMTELFPGFFDRIVVDAPCSGEGMFRKDQTAVEQWSEEHVRMCANRQLTILKAAARCLKPGGVLVYSTCTFAPEENEGTISRFIGEREDFFLEEVPCDGTFAPGQTQWAMQPAPGLAYTMRLWPHRLRGEGHYIARLRRQGSLDGVFPGQSCDNRRKKSGKDRRHAGAGQKDPTEVLQEFLVKELGLAEDWLTKQGGIVSQFGEQLYLVPGDMISMEGIRVLRPGLHLATEKKNRLEPAHSLALALAAVETERILELTHEEAVCYLRGESVLRTAQKGWTLLTYSGYPLGFGKAAGGQMKNHYPKGLRKFL